MAEPSLRLLEEVNTEGLRDEITKIVGKLRWRIGIGAGSDENDVLSLDISNNGGSGKGDGTDGGGAKTVPGIRDTEGWKIGSDEDRRVRKQPRGIGVLNSESDRDVAIL